jgi:hypothetical protein
MATMQRSPAPGMQETTADVIQGQAAADMGVTPEQGPNVNPQEQEMYDTVVNNAVSFINGEESSQTVLNILNNKSIPAEENVGKVVAQITKAMQRSAEASGTEIPGDILFHAGAEITEYVVDMAVDAGIVMEDEAEDIVQKGFMRAVDMFGQESLNDGTITPEKMEKAKVDMAIGQEAENEGLDPMQEIASGGQNLRMNPVAAGVQQASRGMLGAR